MKYVTRTIKVILFLLFAGLLHYALPQHDIVRVVNTYQERQDLNDWTRIFWATPDDQSATLINRDVQFIQTVRKKTWLLGFVQRDSEGVMVYRNEDTGWSWPFYFKFDTASLQTEADDIRSTPESPKWAVITHYGWRNEFLSTFPNAIAIRPVADPAATIIPWFNIFVFVFLAVVALTLRGMWRQFRERSIDPMIHKADAAIDGAEDKARGFWGRWFGRSR